MTPNNLEAGSKLAFLIEYDGTRFSGWQMQGRGRTVQAELEAAFQQITNQAVRFHGAGRTDAGVHARGMVGHVKLKQALELPTRKLVLAMNATTGQDLVVRDIRPVHGAFHARHSALSRSYRYTISTRRRAIGRDYTWFVHQKLEPALLQSAAELLLGDHDFTSYSKKTADVEHYRCTIEESEWRIHGTSFVLRLRANRFVRGMVRALVGRMVQVAIGRITLQDFEHLLHHPQEIDRAKNLAPAQGLVFHRVDYPPDFGLW